MNLRIFALAAAAFTAQVAPALAAPKDVYVKPAGDPTCMAVPATLNCVTTITAAIGPAGIAAAGDTVHIGYDGGTPYDEAPTTSGRADLTIVGDAGPNGERPIWSNVSNPASPLLGLGSGMNNLVLRRLDLRQTGGPATDATKPVIESTAGAVKPTKLTFDDLVALGDAGVLSAAGTELVILGSTLTSNQNGVLVHDQSPLTVRASTIRSLDGLSPAVSLSGVSSIEDTTISSRKAFAVTAGAGSMRRVRFEGGGGALFYNTTGPDRPLEVSNSLLLEPNDPTVAAVVHAVVATGDSPSSALTLRNTTVRAFSSGSAGVFAYDSLGSAGTIVRLANSVVRGTGFDLFANPARSPAYRAGRILVDHSNYASVGSGSAPIEAGEGNLSLDPLWINPIAGSLGNFHVASADSPLVDTGAPVASATTDLDGIARPLGDGVDMGAYESTFTKPPPTPAPAASPTPTPAPAAQATPTPSPTPVARRPKPGEVVRFQVVKRCLTRGVVRVRIDRPAGTAVERVELFVAKTRVRRVTPTSEEVTVTLKRLPTGLFTIRAYIALGDGTTLTTARKYRGCAKKQAAKKRT